MRWCGTVHPLITSVLIEEKKTCYNYFWYLLVFGSSMIQGWGCNKAVVRKLDCKEVLFWTVPVSALPSHGSLCPPALPAALLVGTASPNPGDIPWRSLAWTPETHPPPMCWRHGSRRPPQTPSWFSRLKFHVNKKVVAGDGYLADRYFPVKLL